MKTLEDQIKSQERRPLPREWKAEILTNAAVTPKQDPSGAIAWLFPRWLRLGIAVVWTITLTLHLSIPRDPHAREIITQRPSTPPSVWLASNPHDFEQLSNLLLPYD